jgi:hypothetical protein
MKKLLYFLLFAVFSSIALFAIDKAIGFSHTMSLAYYVHQTVTVIIGGIGMVVLLVTE